MTLSTEKGCEKRLEGEMVIQRESTDDMILIYPLVNDSEHKQRTAYVHKSSTLIVAPTSRLVFGGEEIDLHHASSAIGLDLTSFTHIY